MRLVERALLQRGYVATTAPTFGYHLAPLEYHAARAAEALAAIRKAWPDAEIDVVTHSYGGILARAALAQPHAPEVRRIVMVSPPNQGARVAAAFRTWLPVHRAGWDPLAQFLPGAPGALPALTAEVGILTGGRGTVRGMNPWLGADNDGTIRVDEAHLDGAADFLVIPVQHSWMLFSPRALAQVHAFLDNGRFARP